MLLQQNSMILQNLIMLFRLCYSATLTLRIWLFFMIINSCSTWVRAQSRQPVPWRRAAMVMVVQVYLPAYTCLALYGTVANSSTNWLSITSTWNEGINWLIWKWRVCRVSKEQRILSTNWKKTTYINNAIKSSSPSIATLTVTIKQMHSQCVLISI